jgi:hypothetical protein
MPWRFLLAGALFCALVVLVTSLLPGNVSSTQVARAWRTISLPLTAAREGWEKAFSTINAPPGSVGGGFATTSVRAGGPRSLGDAEIMRIRSPKFDYWRAVAWDRYSGQGWQSTVGEPAGRPGRPHADYPDGRAGQPGRQRPAGLRRAVFVGQRAGTGTEWCPDHE